jgi:hypothetical protein
MLKATTRLNERSTLQAGGGGWQCRTATCQPHFVTQGYERTTDLAVAKTYTAVVH